MQPADYLKDDDDDNDTDDDELFHCLPRIRLIACIVSDKTKNKLVIINVT